MSEPSGWMRLPRGTSAPGGVASPARAAGRLGVWGGGGGAAAAAGGDVRPRGRVVARERGEKLRDLGRRRGHVGVGEDEDVAVAGEHAGPDRGALAAARHAEELEAERRILGDGGLGAIEGG